MNERIVLKCIKKFWPKCINETHLIEIPRHPKSSSYPFLQVFLNFSLEYLSFLWKSSMEPENFTWFKLVSVIIKKQLGKPLG